MDLKFYNEKFWDLNNKNINNLKIEILIGKN